MMYAVYAWNLHCELTLFFSILCLLEASHLSPVYIQGKVNEAPPPKGKSMKEFVALHENNHSN